MTANTREDYLMKTEMLHGMLDVIDMEGQLTVYFIDIQAHIYVHTHILLLTSNCILFASCFVCAQGDEEHVSGWDLIYDNGFIEIDPEQCGYTTFLGAAVPQPEEGDENEMAQGYERSNGGMAAVHADNGHGASETSRGGENRESERRRGGSAKGER